MDKDKLIEELRFENKMLRCENEYIKKNLAQLTECQKVARAEAESSVVRFILKVRRRLKRG